MEAQVTQKRNLSTCVRNVVTFYLGACTTLENNFCVLIYIGRTNVELIKHLQLSARVRRVACLTATKS